MKLRYVLLLCVLLVAFVPSVVLGNGTADVTVTALPCAAAAPNVTNSNATSVTGVGAILHGNITNVCGTATTRGFEWGTSTGNYSWSWNETGSFDEGVFQHSIGSLSVGTQYFWIAFAVTGAGRGNSTELSFTTLGIPYAPTNFDAFQTGSTSVNITWTMGNGATRTIIRGKANECPTSLTDGYLVYNGTGTSASDSDLNFDFNNYCYIGYSWNTNGYSTDYAQDTVEGGSLTGTFNLLGLFALCGIISFMSLRSRFYLLKLLAGAAWIALFVYWMSAPPAGISQGSPAHIAVMIVIFGLAVAIPIMGLGREIDTQKDWRGALTSQKTGAFQFQLPDWMRTNQEEVNRQNRRENIEDYRDRIRSALRPSKRSKQ